MAEVHLFMVFFSAKKKEDIQSLFETLFRNSFLVFKNLKIKNFFDKLFLKFHFWKLF